MPFKYVVEKDPAKPAQGDTPSRSPVYVTSWAPDGVKLLEGLHTCWDIFSKSAEKYSERPCLAFREPAAAGAPAGPYQHHTYAEALALVDRIGSAYSALGAKPQDRVGVFGSNSQEWMLAMQGCNRMSLTCVPVYDTLGHEVIEYVLNHSEAVLVAAQGTKLAALARSLPKLQRKLLAVVYWGAAPEDAVQAVEASGTKLLSWEALLALGEASPADPVPPSPEDLSTIMYTSGTTGSPKGVMHTHSAVLATVASGDMFLKHYDLPFDDTDTYFSFLTLAHIFDRVVEEMMLMVGACIGYYSGDMHALMSDVAAFKPTLFAGVPRVYERVYGAVTAKVDKSGVVARTLFSAALAWKQWWTRMGWPSHKASPLADALVFSKVGKVLGGKLRLLASGAAPLPQYAEEFLKSTLCAPLVQGYGLTETCAASFISLFTDPSHVGTVGPPLPGVELVLESVPEMGCDALAPSLPRGEVCVRGPQLFKGYYKDEEKTKAEMDAEGFFHTGDIGELQPCGTLKIVDRKKNIFKLSQGEYIAVERVESSLGKCGLLEQLWVYGNSFESVLVAVAVPNKRALMAWAAAEGVDHGGDFEAVCADPRATAKLVEELNTTGRSEKLKGFELVKAVHLEPTPFSVDNGLMTPKFSLKRPQLLAHYQKVVDDLYADFKKRAAVKAAAPPAGATTGGAAK